METRQKLWFDVMGLFETRVMIDRNLMHKEVVRDVKKIYRAAIYNHFIKYYQELKEK